MTAPRPRGAAALAACLLLVLALAACLLLVLALAVGCAFGSRGAGGGLIFRYDQLGYPAGAAKRVLVMSPRAVAHRGFAAIALEGRSAGRAVLRGRASGPERWSPRYRVYALDLSRLRAPGRYIVRFAGARSGPLTVGVSARALYAPLTADALSFLQSQRDGSEVLPGPLRRVPSHLRDAAAAVYASPAYRGQRLVGALTPTGAHVAASGGWFDAGDYLKFVQTSSFTDAVLLFTLRTYPAAVADAPALEAEARYGTDWLLRMWDQQQRVLYYQVGIGDGNGRSILGDHDLWRLPQADERAGAAPGTPSPRSPTYFARYRPVFAAGAPGAPLSPNLAGRLAGAFGLCAQVFAVSDPAYAHRCLLAGQTIYDQADTHPHGALLTSAPHVYYDETEWRDDMELGATELYLATQLALGGRAGGVIGLPHGEVVPYLNAATLWANAYIEAPGSGQDSLNLYDVSMLADRDLVGILRDPRAQAQLESNPSASAPTDVRSLLADRADQLRLGERLARREPFGLANPSTNLDTVAHALGYAIEARMYDELAGGGAFAAFAQRQLDWALGANAWGSSFVVGAGARYPHCLAAQIANLAGSLSGRGAIARGAVIEGPTAPEGLRHLELPEGARRCSVGGLAAFDGHGLAYRDDVRASASSEPSDDLTALLLLAAAQAGAG